MGLIEWFIEPLRYDFMQQALFGALIVALACAVLSCYLVLKGWSLMGDAISHAVLPGIVLAFALGIPLVVGAFISGIVCALGTGYLTESCRVKEDAVMGILFSGMFALGLILYQQFGSSQPLQHILFGNMLGITERELIQIVIISTLTLGIVALKWRDLMLFSFDPIHAKVIGLPVQLLHYLLLSLLALTIVASMQAVGVILVVAMLVAPGIIGLMLTQRFSWMMVIAILSSLLATLMGILISFHIDGDTGPTIVLSQMGLFLLAFLFNQMRGIWRRSA